MSNSLDQDLAQHFVGPDLGPNCLQRLSADNISSQRVKFGFSHPYQLAESISNFRFIVRHF